MDVDEARTGEENYIDDDTVLDDATDDMYSRPAPHAKYFEGAAKTFGKGKTIFDHFFEKEDGQKRKDNTFYPFSGRPEWELAAFLLSSGLSLAAVDDFLSLTLIKSLQLTFNTAKSLRDRAESLPKGPEWKTMPWDSKMEVKKPLHLFYRDPLDCVQSLMSNPLLQDVMEFVPYQLFSTASHIMREYSEWASGNQAWEIQAQLPPGATNLGTIITSDKTDLSRQTGGRQAHPALISLANIRHKFRMKAIHHCFLMFALLPVPKYVHPNKALRGVLENRLIHACLDFILRPLKECARIGCMVTDPSSWKRYGFTTLASYIADTPESHLVACVTSNTSSVTTATGKQINDGILHPPHTASYTLQALEKLYSDTRLDPWKDFAAYVTEAKDRDLNGVHLPFWRDWPLAEPSTFLTPEVLHHWHKGFWDHESKWAQSVVGAQELDFRLSILHPHTGYRHFSGGISHLKQVTGREHRDLQRYLLAVIADAVPKGVYLSIRGLLDFKYRGQLRRPSEDDLTKMDKSLALFHSNKNALVKAGAREGKRGAKPWNIPKIEFLSSVTASVRASGNAIQWSADVTERAHITEVKMPAENTNNQKYEPQICRHLDRMEKCRTFDLTSALVDAGAVNVTEGRIQVSNIPDTSINSDDAVNTAIDSLIQINPVGLIDQITRDGADYFQLSRELESGLSSTAPRPFRTFIAGKIAVHLNRHASTNQLSVDEASKLYNIPDFLDALRFLQFRLESGEKTLAFQRKRNLPSKYNLCIDQLKFRFWDSIRIQTDRSSFEGGCKDEEDQYLSQTINCAPPSQEWKFGRADSVLVNKNLQHVWLRSRLTGHTVAELRMVFEIIPPCHKPLPKVLEGFFMYCGKYDIVNQINAAASGTNQPGPFPEELTDFYLLKRAMRSGSFMGDILPLNQIRALVDLSPRLGKVANLRLTKYNSLHYAESFWLNKYFLKEHFVTLSTT